MKIRFIFLSIICITGILTQAAYSQPSFPVKGYVYNIETEKPVFNANIIAGDTNIGASSDARGYFELSLPGGEYTIRITSLGFSEKDISIRVHPENMEVLKIGMLPERLELEEVDVFGRFSIPGRDTSVDRVEISVLPAVTKITALEIEKQGAVTLSDALKFVPGGWTESRGRKSKQFFSVRGQKYPFPDYSIDGIWQKEFEETAYFLSALDIESIEIIRSSNALVKGLSGLTGVVEIKTKKPQRETFSFLTKYGEHHNYLANLQYGNKIKDVSFNTSTAFFGTNGIPGRMGKERIANFHGNMDWKINNKLTLSAGATSVSGSREFVSIVEPGSSKLLNQEEKFDPLHTILSYAKLNFKGKNGSQTELQTNMTYRNANYQNYNISKDTLTSHLDKDREYGIKLLHSRALTASNTLRAGAQYNHWLAPDGKRYYAGHPCDLHTWSAVIADEQKMGRFVVDAAFRVIGGYITEWGGFGIEGSGAAFTNVAPIVDQPASTEWQSAMGLAYVLSAASSLHYNFSGGTIAPRNGSLNATGETPLNEGRFQHEFGYRYLSDKQNEITISSFYTQRKNALDLSGKTMISENDLLVELYENLDKRTYGLEFTSKLNLPALRTYTFANAMFMKAEKVSDGEMVRDQQLPEMILNAGFFYEHSGLDASILINYIGPYTNNRFVNPGWVLENGDYPLGDFVSADLSAGYTFAGKFSKRVFVEVKNIFNEKYETVACYPDQGRFFQAGIKMSNNAIF